MESAAIIDAIVSHAMTTGYFEEVNGHEVKNAPQASLTGSVFVQSVGTAPRHSGLNSSTARLVFRLRIYKRMVNPGDEADAGLVEVTDQVFKHYHSDFALDGLVKAIDLLGQSGLALNAQGGYVTIDKTLYRVMDIDIPVIVNDAWEQVA